MATHPPGFLVRAANGRLCVALPVTRRDLRRGLNARKPGWHLFRGYWYGRNPFDHASYGKIEGPLGPAGARRIGRVHSHHQLRKLNL